MAKPLEQEMRRYEAELPLLLQHEGKYVLIADDQVIDTYDTYADAIKAGYEKKKLEPFLVKQIKPADFMLYFTRPVLSPCRT